MLAMHLVAYAHAMVYVIHGTGLALVMVVGKAKHATFLTVKLFLFSWMVKWSRGPMKTKLMLRKPWLKLLVLIQNGYRQSTLLLKQEV
jgi:hypothetical protein